jgi:hypothetical protein
MDRITIKYPNAMNISGSTFSDDLVGFQLVQGGGLTQANFKFTTNIGEKVNRSFDIGSFSKPITLDTLKITNEFEARAIIAKEFSVYPNFDLSEITKFSLYGSLTKRLSSSVEKIINFFPAALEVYSLNDDFTRNPTAINSYYDFEENVTIFEIDVIKLTNPFEIDYSTNATRNLSLRENQVSPLRNFTEQFNNYSLFFNNNEYPVFYIEPSESLYSGKIGLTVSGNPFSGASTVYDTLVIRPNTFFTDKSFTEPFDEVEEFLLNRLVSPKYTAKFNVPKESNDGTKYMDFVQLTWPLGGVWNLDITSIAFTGYLEGLNEVAKSFDEETTNLVVRFLTTDAVKEFDTDDQRVQKLLSIYGRSFDDTKKFIDALAHITSVNYLVKNDIPSQLLRNLAETLGWKINISPIQNTEFLDAVFGNGESSVYSGFERQETPNELNYQFYRNLILNSGYLFKSKGTRKSIEFLLRLVGAPEALIEFNETIYVAGQKISLSQFYNNYAKISGGTLVSEVPVLTNQTFTIRGVPYSATSTETVVTEVDVTLDDYPIDINGYPKRPRVDEDFFFQKGAGWFELVDDHQSPLIVNYTNDVFTGQNFDVQTEFENFTYGQKYLDRFRKFPYMNMGFGLTKKADNRKSWTSFDDGLRKGNGESKYESSYFVNEDELILNVKNVDLYINPSQGLIYDVWYMSNQYGYPIPYSGLTSTGIQPSKVSFFEFCQNFYQETVNVRDRLYVPTGNAGGNCVLQYVFQLYQQSQQAIGIPNNNFYYTQMLDYVSGLEDYWIRLVEQMVPATTIWNGGTKIENSIFNRQKFAYRIQRCCRPILIPCAPCVIKGPIFNTNCTDESLNCPVYPWVEKGSTVQSFSDILNQTVTNYMSQNNLICDLNSLITNWYIQIVLDGNVVFEQMIYTGYGLFDSPTEFYWKQQLQNYLPTLSDQYLVYFLNGDYLYVSNAGCEPMFANKKLQLNVGMDFKLSCD